MSEAQSTPIESDRAATQRIIELARGAGFALAGICAARESEHADAVRRWFAMGKHGSMSWLADEIPVRIDSRRLQRGGRTILCLADRYAIPRHGEETVDVLDGRPRGRIARYARGDDYHKVMRKRLRALASRFRHEFPGESFRIACDLLPILERECAAGARLGQIGKHTLLIERGGSSYVLLGEVLTTMNLVLSAPSSSSRSDPCGSCTACIDACPTGAIEPWSVDASRCISYTTIEHRDEVPEEFWSATGDWVFGCDVCQEVCPHNQPTRKKRSSPVHPAYAERNASFDLLDILGWSEEDRLAATMRSAIRRATLPMLKRNALICIANAMVDASEQVIRLVRARLIEVAEDACEAEMVRATARTALRRIGDRSKTQP